MHTQTTALDLDSVDRPLDSTGEEINGRTLAVQPATLWNRKLAGIIGTAAIAPLMLLALCFLALMFLFRLLVALVVTAVER